MVACFFMTESHAQNKGNSLNLASQLTMSKTIRRTIDPKVLKGHPPLNKSPRAIMEPRMGTNGHEWGGGNYETHEIHERIIQNHERTRMDTKRWEGTTKHTNGTKEKFRTTNGHGWTRMGGREPRNTRMARKDNPEDFVPPNDLFCRQRPGGCREWRLHSIIHKR